MKAFLQQHFTEKGLVLEGYPIQSIERGKIHVTNSRGDVVASMRFVLGDETLVLESLVRRGRPVGNNTHKGIANSLLPLLLSEAYRFRIPTVTLTAVPDARGAEAQRLFDYYTKLGAKPIRPVQQNLRSNIQDFQYDVESTLPKFGIDPSAITQIPMNSESESSYSWMSSRRHSTNNGGHTRKQRGRARRHTRGTLRRCEKFE